MLYRLRFAAPVAGLLITTCAYAAGPRREAFLGLIDRPRVPLAAETALVSETEGLEKYRFSFASEKTERVPGILIKAKTGAGKLPVIVVLHGTGGRKAGQEKLLKELAGRGLIAVAIDGRYHGERSKAGSGSAEYVDAILRAYRTGKEHPFLYDTVWDVLRLLDYLESRSDVDATRIAVMGFSKGGMETYLAAAADPRIRVAVPLIGVQSFRWALEHDAWQARVSTFQEAVNTAAKDEGTTVDAAFMRRFYDRVTPGIHGEFDGPAMLPLIAPRPLLVVNGDSDPRTPRPGLFECVEAAKKEYARAGAARDFEFVMQPNTGHKVNPESLERAVEFLVRKLGAQSRQSSRLERSHGIH
jgi:dienelactone hydrolase